LFPFGVSLYFIYFLSPILGVLLGRSVGLQGFKMQFWSRYHKISLMQQLQFDQLQNLSNVAVLLQSSHILNLCAAFKFQPFRLATTGGYLISWFVFMLGCFALIFLLLFVEKLRYIAPCLLFYILCFSFFN